MNFVPALVALVAFSAVDATSPRTFCLPETDTSSPRYTSLQSKEPNPAERVYRDLDQDGDPDVLESWWNGKRVRWLDENDDMRPGDVRGDLVGDCLMVDLDGDGFYDGPGDLNIKWVDSGRGASAELQVIGINPPLKQSQSFAGASHYMIFQDIDADGVLGYFDWSKFNLDCWRVSEGANFSPDYNGNSLFLKEHNAPFTLTDPGLNWENPFAFYDFDMDGCTEMAIRFVDERKFEKPDQSVESFDARVEQAFVTFDVDNDSQRGNEMDFDLSLLLEGGQGIDYASFRQPFPRLKAPDWAQPFFRFTNWRTNDSLTFVPHSQCFAQAFTPAWGKASFVFDEDDDDHRWERVELYYPGDPYNTARRGSGTNRSIAWHPQADSLGDRGEWDSDFSGKGQLYITKWDGKIHLLGAETGAWTVDRERRFWGATPVRGNSSPLQATNVLEVVLYRDSDTNGFFDEISFDYDGDKTVDLKVSLLDFATEEEPHPDQGRIIDPRQGWEALRMIFTGLSNRSWSEAMQLYRAAWKRGLTTAEMDNLAIAASIHERYEHAYWLKETLLRALLKGASPQKRAELLKAYYLADTARLVQLIETWGS